MEGYEGVEALVRGRPPQTPRYARGAPLKPVLVVVEGMCLGWMCLGWGGRRCVGGGWVRDGCGWGMGITIKLYSISRECY